MHELAFLLLVAVTGALGGMWAYFWQQSSAESVRINALLFEALQLRGDLYREIKEVTRARLVQDPTALERYWSHLYRMDSVFNRLRQRTRGAAEAGAVQEMRQAYELMQTEMNKLFAQPNSVTDAARVTMLDPAYEQWILGDFETALREFSELIAKQRVGLEENLAQWTRLAPIVIPAPILLAVALLVYSHLSFRRGFVQPMHSVTDGALEISQGKLEHRIPARGVKEVVQLAHSINDMARDLSESRNALVDGERQAALGALVPVVAHNIRNPLASIRAAAQVIDVDDEEELEEAKAAITGTVDRLERWVRSLLSYLNPLEPHRTSVNLASVVDGALAALTPKFKDKGIALERGGWDQDREVNLDADLLEQALYGLVNNALEASPNQGKIFVTLQDIGKGMQVLIDDQGPGMPEGAQPMDLSPGPTTKRYGTGLGLPFAFKVVHVHGGAIHYDRSPAGGTRVALFLPR